MMYHSQNNEAAIIDSYFKNQVNTFLDLGSNNGIMYSNVYDLIKNKQWRGVCVEASPSTFVELCHNMSTFDIHCFNYAITDHDGEIDFYESGSLISNNDKSLVSTLKSSELKRWTSRNIEFKKIIVPCRTIKSLIEESPIKSFSLISVDIEGSEKEVVPQIDFTALGTKMAIIEWNGKHGEYYDNLLAAHSLKLIHTNAENRIYAK